MKIAVLGAGLTGLTSAHRLSKEGHEVDVYERWPGLGGQAATFDLGDGVLLERYYHHLFTSDRHIAALYNELGLPDEIELHESSTAFFVDHRSWPFTTPLDLLCFKPVSPITRLRMGLAVIALQRSKKPLASFEDVTAKDWIVAKMGQQAWDVVWAPLLRGKFGRRSEEIAMVWLARKFQLRRDFGDHQTKTEKLGYPRHSWELLFDRLTREIESRGGRVLIDTPAARISRAKNGLKIAPGAAGSFRRGHDPRAFRRRRAKTYDRVVAAVPTETFEQLLDEDLRAEVGAEYLHRATSIEVQAALCLLLVCDASISPHYWTNIADEDLPFLGVIEHTRFVERERYGGRHIIYVTNYLEASDPLMSLSADELFDHYLPGLQLINPGFQASAVKEKRLFGEPYAQPIVDIGYRERIPALQTPAVGLFMANPTQVYPEDRGTNYAVRLGEQVAKLVLTDA